MTLTPPTAPCCAPSSRPRSTTIAGAPVTTSSRVWSADLVRSGLPDPDPIAHHVVRMPSVYPVYDHAFAAKQAVVEAWITAQSRLVAVGRQALFAHDNTHHALEMGRAAGRYAVAGADDPAGWWAVRERFRGHVVED